MLLLENQVKRQKKNLENNANMTPTGNIYKYLRLLC